VVGQAELLVTAILFIGAPDLDAVYAHLRTKGIDVKEPKLAPYGTK